MVGGRWSTSVALGLTRWPGMVDGEERRWGGALFFAAEALAGLDRGVRLPGDGIALPRPAPVPGCAAWK